MDPARTRPSVDGQVGFVPLEFRLRQLRHRRRRAVIRQLLIGACWSAGLLSVGAFVLALSIGVRQ